MPVTNLSPEEFDRKAGQIIRDLHNEVNILEQEDNLITLFMGYLEARGDENDDNIRYQFVIFRNLLRQSLLLEPSFFHKTYKQHEAIT